VAGGRVDRNSDIFLDDDNFHAAADSQVRQWTCNGLVVQQWRVP